MSNPPTTAPPDIPIQGLSTELRKNAIGFSIAPLGDTIENALTSLGITKDRVAKWLGRPCNCNERKEKLNQLDLWARRIISGKLEKARHYLDNILNDGVNSSTSSEDTSNDQAK